MRFLTSIGCSRTSNSATRAVPAQLADANSQRVLATLSDVVRAPLGGAPEVALQGEYQHGRLRLRVAAAPARANVLARGALVSATSLPSEARVALGVDGEGFLVFAEAATASRLQAALAEAGVSAALGFASAHLVLETPTTPDAGVPDAGAEPSALAPDPNGLTFLADTRPAADVLFSDVKPVPYRRWGWLQDQRVRYFPTHPARFPTPEAVR